MLALLALTASVVYPSQARQHYIGYVRCAALCFLEALVKVLSFGHGLREQIFHGIRLDYQAFPMTRGSLPSGGGFAEWAELSQSHPSTVSLAINLHHVCSMPFTVFMQLRQPFVDGTRLVALSTPIVTCLLDIRCHVVPA